MFVACTGYARIATLGEEVREPRRTIPGFVFLPEGIQKLVLADILGAGRFAGIGIPLPEVTGPFVGLVEIVCGALILIGLFTRLAAVPLVITMIVAIVSTKIPIWLGHDWLIFQVRDLSRYGFWSFMHERRTDWAMLTCALYLLAERGTGFVGRCAIPAGIDTPIGLIHLLRGETSRATNAGTAAESAFPYPDGLPVVGRRSHSIA